MYVPCLPLKAQIVSNKAAAKVAAFFIKLKLYFTRGKLVSFYHRRIGILG